VPESGGKASLLLALKTAARQDLILRAFGLAEMPDFMAQTIALPSPS